MYLFKNLIKKNSRIITDEENKEFNVIKKIATKRKIKRITIGSNSGNLRILNNRYDNNKQIIKFAFNSKIFQCEIPLIGFFQVKNLFLAALSALSCGLSQKKIFSLINNVKPVPGRLECVSDLKNNSKIIVDFAHTPDALKKSLQFEV